MNNICAVCGINSSTHEIYAEVGPCPEAPEGYGCQMDLCEACFMKRLERLHAEMTKDLEENGPWPIYTGDGE